MNIGQKILIATAIILTAIFVGNSLWIKWGAQQTVGKEQGITATMQINAPGYEPQQATWRIHSEPVGEISNTINPPPHRYAWIIWQDGKFIVWCIDGREWLQIRRAAGPDFFAQVKGEPSRMSTSQYVPCEAPQ